VIDYQTFHQIRQLCDQEQMTVTQIAAALKLDERTVGKWIECQT
jgi:DNA-binding transcriptional regulator YiaG